VHRLFGIAALFLCSGVLYSQSEVVYPLQPGDRWQYNSSGWDTVDHIYTRFVGAETLMTNGHTYSSLSPEFFRSWLERTSDSKVSFYDFSTNEDRLLFDFTRPAGDTVSSFPSPYWPEYITYITTSGPLETELIFGALRRSWWFSIDWIDGANDDEQYVHIVDSIGVVEQGGWMWHDSLLGAVVNGITYGVVTAVSDPRPQPSSISLTQNYPNPFNPSTTIEVDLDETTDLTLRVFNLLGQEVATLASGIYLPGVYKFSWTPIDQPGGLYYYRLQANNDFFVKKLVYLR
jgi:hypothetical protein